MNERQAAAFIAAHGPYKQNAGALRSRYRQAKRDKNLTALRLLFTRIRETVGDAGYVEAMAAGVGGYIDGTCGRD